MAIVIKEASKTPLALGQLAETMANTYLQHNKMQHDYKIAEQNAIWKSKQMDAYQTAHDTIQGMDPSAFTQGAAGQQLMAANALSGKDSSSLFASSGSNPEWMGKRDALIPVLMDSRGLSYRDAFNTATFNVLGATSMKQSPTGLAVDNYIPGISAATGQSGQVSSNEAGNYTAMNLPPAAPAASGVANNAQSLESATMTGSGATGVYTTKSGEVWTNAEVQEIARKKGITPQQALKIIKDNDV